MRIEDFYKPKDIPHARTSDPATSQLSAFQTEAVEGTTTVIRPNTLKHVALAHIAATPSTPREVEIGCGRRGIWKRVSDLKNAKLVEPTGETRKDPWTDRAGEVMQITDRGEDALDRLDRGEDVRF